MTNYKSLSIILPDNDTLVASHQSIINKNKIKLLSHKQQFFFLT